MDSNIANILPLTPEEEKKEIIDAIITSTARKKIVVGGPGTGKTRLFQQICRELLGKGKAKNLTLTFINELVNDLELELRDLSEVRTFHSFAFSKVPGNAVMFLDLTKVIQKDYKKIEDKDVKFEEAFHNLTGLKEDLDFYSRRRQYYDFYGPDCSVYALLKLFERDRDKIPRYTQIMIDEFQDFNKLECAIIDLLAEHSPILIAGDDDQALYPFKHADAEEIRKRHGSDDYDSYLLPFCSRCTEVVIRAFNAVVDTAKREGYLSKRIDKGFRYLPNSDKDKACINYPKIIVKTSAQSNQLASLIDTEIKKLIDPADKSPKTILVICPLNDQVKRVSRMLKERGYTNIQTPESNSSDLLMQGFNLLLKTNGNKSNLGWRIVSEEILIMDGNESTFDEILRKNNADIISNSPSKAQAFWTLTDKELRNRIRKAVAILRKVSKKEELTDDERDLIFKSGADKSKFKCIEGTAAKT